MGICSLSKSNPNVVMRSLIRDLRKINTKTYPDIANVVDTTLRKYKIKENNLNKEVAQAILNDLQGPKVKNSDQKFVIDKLQRCFLAISSVPASQLLEEALTTVSIEVYLYVNQLKRKVTESQTWWDQEHFKWRIKELLRQYQTELPNIKNPLIQYLELLRDCIILDQIKNKSQQQIQIQQQVSGVANVLPKTRVQSRTVSIMQ